MTEAMHGADLLYVRSIQRARRYFYTKKMSNLGFSMLPKDTFSMQSESGMTLLTFWLVDNLFYILNNSHDTERRQNI